ncbi:AAC(3) family N-acetyltransferase [Prochlorococcus marinus]|uniref:AAC(3) family N-acetyltransferase n=1 Tax=Prochlorococcus marinus TaxID=1219 RepID=UPI0022B54805|nr:AAC(3) family N-acetyltransferase [Prochlorococcus marinus]
MINKDIIFNLLDDSFNNLGDSEHIWLSLDLVNILIPLKIKKKTEIEETLEFIVSYLQNNILLSTIIIPSFTFDFPKSRIFHTHQSNPSFGSFSRYLFERRDISRSIHPFYSFFVFGKDKDKFLDQTSSLTDSIGNKSVFNYINTHKFKILSIGHHYVSALTPIHHTEYLMDADYRELISFNGKLIDPVQDYSKEGTFLFYGRKRDRCKFSGVTKDAVLQYLDNSISNQFIYTRSFYPIGYYTLDLHLSNKYTLENHNKRNILFDMINNLGDNNSEVISKDLSVQLYNKLINDST